MCNEYNYTDDDHIPFTVTLLIENVPETSGIQNSCAPRIQWDKLSDDNCSEYCTVTEQLLSNINVPDPLNCQNLNCCDHEHILAIKNFYNDIINCLKIAVAQAIPDNRNKRHYSKPGWSEYVADLYKMPRDSYKV